MKAYIIQPPYSMDYTKIEENFKVELSLLDECDENADIIILPEFSDVLAATPSEADFIEAVEKFNPILDERVRKTAIRCKALIFANYCFKTPDGYRNTTHVINEKGETVGRYFKEHPAPSEIKMDCMDTEYSNHPQEVYTFDWNGLRFGFRTCYDFYFYEDIVKMARKDLDIIIGCSYQRTDTHRALEIMNTFLAYNTNAYVLRASISFGEGSEVAGCSMAVSPRGEILANMKNRVGIEVVEFNPTDKYYKVSGFGGTMKSHYQYVDEGRKI